MVIEMNPKDDEVLDNSADIHDGLGPDGEPSIDPGSEHDAGPDIENDPEPGLVPDFEHVPRGAQLI